MNKFNLKVNASNKLFGQSVIMKHQVTDVKPASNTKAEADECLFEYLHGEMVNYVIGKTSNDGNVSFINTV